MDAVGANPHNRRHRCVFVTGLIVSEERDEILLTGGNNDGAVILVRYKLGETLAALRGVQADPGRCGV